MPSRSLNEIIQMYSTGVISRECLEREIRSWELDEDARDMHRGDTGNSGDCITLYPDASGTWRAAS